ncbi:hypothetical protein AQUCO_01100182v1 [Aquilegia coerulea]|uniref:Uncharacterized protein n=1 Tax=Aquilegia coerulea TaxID=218851 RepID=A0A2G5E5W0_AQUCA|nr:hypothetical protein AQUCO_01100182v1 [Aquilegia coerulea]
MGNSQSTKRPSFFPSSSSDYTRLPSSPSKQPLLKDDTHSYSDQYELKDILKKNTDNAKKITQLEQKVEYLEKLVTSKSATVEGCIMKTIATDEKVIELDKKVERLKHLLFAKKTNERSIQENLAYEKKLTEREKKIESLERQLIANNTVRETNIIAKNTAREANMINLMDAEADELALMALNHQNNKHEMEWDKDTDEPEYVNRLMGLILMLIFLVFISIGMQL